MPSASTLFTIYLVLAIIGASFTIFSFIFGGGAEDGDVHFDGHADASHPDGGSSGITLSDLLSLRNFLMFLVGFGAVGMEMTSAGYNAWQSSFGGVVGGIVLAAIGFLFYRMIAKQQGSSVTKLGALAGKQAQVITSIPEDGYGEIRLNDQFGASITLMALSKDGPLSAGSCVEVVAVVANAATVKKVA